MPRSERLARNSPFSILAPTFFSLNFLVPSINLPASSQELEEESAKFNLVVVPRALKVITVGEKFYLASGGQKNGRYFHILTANSHIFIGKY